MYVISAVLLLLLLIAYLWHIHRIRQANEALDRVRAHYSLALEYFAMDVRLVYLFAETLEYPMTTHDAMRRTLMSVDHFLYGYFLLKHTFPVRAAQTKSHLDMMEHARVEARNTMHSCMLLLHTQQSQYVLGIHLERLHQVLNDVLERAYNHRGRVYDGTPVAYETEMNDATYFMHALGDRRPDPDPYTQMSHGVYLERENMF